MTPDTARPDDDDGPRLPVRQSGYQTVLLVGVVIVALAAAGVAVWFRLTHKPEPIPTDLTSKFKDLNFSFEPPPAPWVRDEDTRQRLGGQYLLVYKRENPEAYMAFGAQKFDPRSPRPSELRRGLTTVLDKLMEPDRKEYADEIDKRWMGRDGYGFKFRGLLKGGGAAEGEALTVSYKGVGYWFVAWTGENEIYAEQKGAFADGRRRCKLLDLREKWNPQSALAEYKSNVHGYAITDPDGLCKEVTDEEDLKYEGADKMLTVALGNKKDLQKRGTLVVLVTDTPGDPLPTARRMVIDRRTARIKEANPEFTVDFSDRTEAPTDPPANTVEQTSPVVRLQSRVKNDPNQNRLHVVSAARIGEKLVVVHAWCDWHDRDDFEGMFMQIAGSLRPN
jgi:hypothetical protein